MIEQTKVQSFAHIFFRLYLINYSEAHDQTQKEYFFHQIALDILITIVHEYFLNMFADVFLYAKLQSGSYVG